MMKERLVAALEKAAAEFVVRESNGRSLITVTRAVVDDRAMHATVYVSVYPDKDTRAACEFLDRQHNEFHRFLKTRINARALPRIRFLPEPDKNAL